LSLFPTCRFAFSILMFYTVCVKTSKTEQTTEPEPKWQTTPVANLLRNAKSGTYYARARVGGKLIWKSLKTDRLSVAQLRLGDFLKEERHKAESVQATARGKMTFEQALKTYRERLKADVSLKDRSKEYREERIAALLKSWPELSDLDVRRISKTDCLDWAGRFAQKASPSAFNNTIGTLRLIVDIAIEAGARYDNPAKHIKRLRIRQKHLKHLKLPSHDEFLKLVGTIRKNDGGWNHRCADMVEFLAYSGCRKGEAARVNGRDCDFEKEEIAVLGDPATGTKNWEIRRVPMIPDMRRLLERLQNERGKQEFRQNPLLEVHECQGAITSACKKLGIERITHHDLRHLFATRCIESGVDIPTVSRWLGHKDGGALAMKTYGHLRDQHSATMAQKVTFSNPPENVIQMPGSAVKGEGASQSSDADERRAIAKAKAKYAYAWWASANPQEIFWGQLHEDVPIIPTEKFLEAATRAMGREVFSQELNDRQSLREEFSERIRKATIVELTGKIRPKDTKGN
jgi:integrase